MTEAVPRPSGHIRGTGVPRVSKRSGPYFLEWRLERRRTEEALVSMVATTYLPHRTGAHLSCRPHRRCTSTRSTTSPVTSGTHAPGLAVDGPWWGADQAVPGSARSGSNRVPGGGRRGGGRSAIHRLPGGRRGWCAACTWITTGGSPVGPDTEHAPAARVVDPPEPDVAGQGPGATAQTSGARSTPAAPS